MKHENIKVKVLIDRHVEVEVPVHGDRNAAIRTQLSSSLKPSERLIEYTCVDEAGTPFVLDNDSMTYIGFQRQAQPGYDAHARLWQKGHRLDNRMERVLREIRYEDIGFRTTPLSLSGDLTKPSSYGFNKEPLPSGQDSANSCSKHPSKLHNNWPNQARITRVPLTRATHDILDQTQDQLDLTEHRWNTRKTWKKDDPEGFELLNRERQRLTHMKTLLLDYGPEIAEFRVQKSVKRNETAMQALRDLRDSRALDQMMKGIDGIKIEENTKTHEDLTNPPQPTNPNRDPRIPSSSQPQNPFTYHRHDLYREIQKQRNRSRSPGRNRRDLSDEERTDRESKRWRSR
ncbi:hypothetical protein UCRPC4_g00860 [Phaeomoniella chlamydospora]|uniref:Uncharacterized protein n=1 Tax=Phaeomoniella chlamydospora TaxID=158046 RepID=A0A0G2EYE4_PHACM|nr:hypothetical protein UCRPC4_g00860 [Phaeomoniella chlamydospora]